jgi:hypothetical protein
MFILQVFEYSNGQKCFFENFFKLKTDFEMGNVPQLNKLGRFIAKNRQK